MSALYAVRGFDAPLGEYPRQPTFSHWSASTLFVQQVADISLTRKGVQDGQGRTGSEAIHGQDAVAKAQRKPICQGQTINSYLLLLVLSTAV